MVVRMIVGWMTVVKCMAGRWSVARPLLSSVCKGTKWPMCSTNSALKTFEKNNVTGKVFEISFMLSNEPRIIARINHRPPTIPSKIGKNPVNTLSLCPPPIWMIKSKAVIPQAAVKNATITTIARSAVVKIAQITHGSMYSNFFYRNDRKKNLFLILCSVVQFSLGFNYSAFSIDFHFISMYIFHVRKKVFKIQLTSFMP